MKSWSAFHPLLAVLAPSAPVPLLDSVLREAAIELCTRTKAYTVALDEDVTEAGEAACQLSLPNNTQCIEVLDARCDGLSIFPVTRTEMLALPAKSGKPTTYTQVSPDVLTLYPTPDAAYPYTCHVALAPAMTSTGIEDWLYSRFYRAIADGASARLMLPGFEWSNGELSGYYAGRFEDAISKATVMASGGFNTSRPRFSGRFF